MYNPATVDKNQYHNPLSLDISPVGEIYSKLIYPHITVDCISLSNYWKWLRKQSNLSKCFALHTSLLKEQGQIFSLIPSQRLCFVLFIAVILV